MKVMKIMEINLLKLLVKIIILSFYLLFPLKLKLRSRALVVASQEAVLSSELAARITSISVKEMERFKKEIYLFNSIVVCMKHKKM